MGPSLGVGALISDSFSILTKYFLPILAIFFVPDLLIFELIGWLNESIFTYEADLPFDGSGEMVVLGFAVLIGFIVYSLETAMFVLLAYDAKLGQPMRFGFYFRTLLSNFLPLLLLSFLVLLLLVPALLAFVIPALWVNAVFAAVVPAVVTERAGFGALRRSIELTRNYRWPIVGAFLLGGFFSRILDQVAEKLSLVALEAGSALLEAIIYVTISGIGYAFVGILTALIYVRLREIKEGIGIDQIAAVFD